MRILLSDLAKATGAVVKNSNETPKWCLNISTDTRSLKKSDVFLALRGDHFDGHHFIVEAAKKGALAVILEETFAPQWLQNPESQKIPSLIVADSLKALGDIAQYWRNQFQIPVVGITGSNGKTTTRSAVTTLLSRHYRVHGTEGNLNNLIGMPQTVLGLSAHHEVLVLEMGMNHLGEIARLSQIARPTVGLITNVGPVHVEHLGSIENVAKAKGELFENLDPTGFALVNIDDTFCSQMADAHQIPKNRRVTFGFHPEAQVRVEKVATADPATGDGMGQRVSIKDARLTVPEVFDVELPLPGRHNVYNLLGAVAVGLHLGLQIDEIQLAAKSIKPVGSRTRIVKLNGLSVLDDCYNANPVSMRASLDLFSQIKSTGPKVIVLGDMLELGQISETAHRELGAQAATKSPAHLFAVGAFADSLAQGAISAGFNAKHITVVKPLQGHRPSDEQIAQLVEEMTERDRSQSATWLLVKGSRGVALERVVKVLSEKKGIAP